MTGTVVGQHPICRRRQIQMRIAAVCLLLNIVCVMVAYLLGGYGVMVFEIVWAVPAAAAMARFRWLLRYRCPGRSSEVAA